jgi:hypothetical protein
MIEIENKYLPIIELLEDKIFLESIKREYRGFITANNPNITKARILFIGINPADGAFNELNPKYNSEQNGNNEIKYPNRLFSNSNYTQIDWLKDGNARGEKIVKTWQAYKWFETGKKINNTFVKRMIEFFITFYGNINKSNYAEIENRINSEIFYWNLYPIATKTTKELDIILKKIVSTKIQLNGKVTTNMDDLKNFFRQRTIDLIEKIKPDVIICLGNQAFKELTNSNPKLDLKDSNVQFDTKFRIESNEIYKVYNVSRNGNWEEKIKNLGQKLKAL